MKVLRYAGFFKLPDDFEGNLSDALRLLADYHESEAACERRTIGDPKDDPENEIPNLYNKFWDLIHQTEGRHTAAFNIVKLVDNKFVEISDEYNKRD